MTVYLPRVILSGALLLGAAPLSAQAMINDISLSEKAVMACLSERDDTERLACFDRVAGMMHTALNADDATGAVSVTGTKGIPGPSAQDVADQLATHKPSPVVNPAAEPLASPAAGKDGISFKLPNAESR